jgi:hypothetical protein
MKQDVFLTESTPLNTPHQDEYRNPAKVGHKFSANIVDMSSKWPKKWPKHSAIIPHDPMLNLTARVGIDASAHLVANVAVILAEICGG